MSQRIFSQECQHRKCKVSLVYSSFIMTKVASCGHCQDMLSLRSVGGCLEWCHSFLCAYCGAMDFHIYEYDEKLFSKIIYFIYYCFKKNLLVPIIWGHASTKTANAHNEICFQYATAVLSVRDFDWSLTTQKKNS